MMRRSGVYLEVPQRSVGESTRAKQKVSKSIGTAVKNNFDTRNTVTAAKIDLNHLACVNWRYKANFMHNHSNCLNRLATQIATRHHKKQRFFAVQDTFSPTFFFSISL